MKKPLKLLGLGLATAAMLSIPAFAADFDHCADALNELGLFQGTSTGYDLDRAPTRAEASAMLVRLLGQEEAAQALTYTAPFTDVLDWAKPYVQYLYENGLANGKSETNFGASDPCTAQQYATFLMRALGYSESAGDFTYANALNFAAEQGVVNAFNCDADNFLRDDVVAMSYTALSVAPKSGETDLLTKLVDEGAVADAKGYDELFAAYRSYSAAVGSEIDASHMVMDLALTSTLAGQPFMDAEMDFDIVMDLNEQSMDQSQMAMTGNISATMNEAFVEDPAEASMDQAIEYYYTDGMYYMNMGDEKYKMPLSFEEVMGQLELSDTDRSSSEPLCMLKNLTSQTNGDTTTYTVEYAPGAVNAVLNLAAGMGLESAGVEDLELAITDCQVTVTDNTMTGMDATVEMRTTVEGMELMMNMQMQVTVDNDAVTVTLPNDLNSYQDLDTLTV